LNKNQTEPVKIMIQQHAMMMSRKLLLTQTSLNNNITILPCSKK